MRKPPEDKTKEAERMRAYYLANREKLLAKRKVYYLENREMVLAENKKYHKDHPEVHAKVIAKGRKLYPEKNKARGAVNDAVRRNRIVRPKVCSRCGNEGFIDAHHHDYSKPLDIVFLCKACHINEHQDNH